MMKLLCLCPILLLACRPLPVLGGPTQDTTTHLCWDGSRCSNDEDCPNYSTPGKCEAAAGGIVEQWSARHSGCTCRAGIPEAICLMTCCIGVQLDAGARNVVAAKRCGASLITICAPVVDGGCEDAGGEGP